MRDARFFVDTNVLLYSNDSRNLEKALKASDWLKALTERGAAVINLQVLNECTDVLLRKKWFDEPQRVFETIEYLAELGDSAVTVREVDEARRLHLRYGFSWWDSLLLASAIHLGCSYFLSEDLNDGQAIESLTIVSPFAHSPQQILKSR